MKLYYFNPNDYGEQAFVCAESLEQAKRALRNEIIEITESMTPMDKSMISSKNNTIRAMIECSKGYTVEEFDPMEVVWAEIS